MDDIKLSNTHKNLSISEFGSGQQEKICLTEAKLLRQKYIGMMPSWLNTLKYNENN
jgi:hypothetical protein